MSLLRVVVRCSLLFGISFFSIYPQKANAQAQVPARVVDAVNDANRVTLHGNVHPLARVEFDRGAVVDSQPMNRMLLLLKRSDGQEAALQTMLQNQQDKSSGNFHQWLTPEQFGAQFGPADADIQAVTDWLTRQGFSIGKVYSGKTVIEFSGTAGQVQRAFGTAIHNYAVNGKTYSANASDPEIPAALGPVVAGVVSLHNFPRQFYARRSGSVQRAAGQTTMTPLVTMPNPFGSGNFYGLGPGDFAKIYGSAGLIQAGNDGTGQTIAIVGETNLQVSDVQKFRSVFGLSANFNANNIIYNGEDPGITSTDEEAEADLDTQWSGAVAPGATIKFVLSASTSASQGVDLSALYIVEHNLAGVMSESYGECESGLESTGNSFFNNLWEQASAQGITVAISSGDNGSAGCDDPNQEDLAIHGTAVNGLGSTPYNVSVGGTDFDEYNNWTLYWSTTNNATTGTSALGYIPEIPWNQSCAQLGAIGCNINTTPGELQNIVAGSGGPSAKYSKPSWQMGTAGMPADNKRDLPDISLFASPGFNGTGYLYCQVDVSEPCIDSAGFSGYVNFGIIGGTSASAPAFAGVMALVNQYQASHGGSARQGNANYVLYALANKAGASCASSVTKGAGCVFNDVVAGSSALPTGGTGSGTNSVPCTGRTPECSSTVSGGIGVLDDPNSVGKLAWLTTAGYDLVTGLGSVNIGNLATSWAKVSSVPTTTTLTLSPTTGITHGAENVTTTIGVTPSSGTATGTVSLIAKLSDGTTFGAGQFTLGANGSVTGTAQNLPGGTNYQVHAHYSGDGTNAPSDSTAVSVTVSQESTQTFIVIPSFDQSGNQISGNASSVNYGSKYIIRIYVTNKGGVVSPTGAPTGICTQTLPVACPSGTVTLTSDGVPVDAGVNGPGTYTLDSIGYTRDIAPAVPGGKHTLVATFNGDNSYTSSSASESFTVIPATISMGQNLDTNPPLVAVPLFDEVTAYSPAEVGAGPTGTVTYFDGATQLGKPVAIQSSGSAGYQPAFSAFDTLTINTGGSHTIKAQYSGDANYAPASTSTTVNAIYTTTSNFSANSASINYGSSVTLTGSVNTLVPSSNAALKPSGIVSLSGSYDGPIRNGVSTTVNADGSGNWQIQITAMVTPSSSEGYSLTYSGDPNYESTTAFTDGIAVNIPDFSLGPPNGISVVPTAGQAGSQQFTITPMSSTQQPSAVKLSLTSGILIYGYQISLSPQQVSLNGSAASAMLTLTPANGVFPTIATGNVRGAGILAMAPLRWWSLSLITGLASLLLLRFRNLSKCWRKALGLGIASVVLFAIGCGGGGGTGAGGGGGGGGGTGGGGGVAGPSTIAVTSSSGKVALGASLTITATVTGKNPTGTVTFYDYGNAITGEFTMVAGQAQIGTNAVYGIGIHQITATYSGDLHNLGSTSTAMSQVLTGTVPITIQGTTGSDIHSFQAIVGVQ
jgi:Pro-kumamolisin, activation domain/Bacterial Ig-like domain (group 3)